jgi:hypothetical protein
LICFFVLGAVVILIIQTAVPQNGIPMLDLTALFQALNDPTNWPQYRWLGFMMFSTLLPTLAHAVLALVALFLGALKPAQSHLGEWIAGGPVAAHIAWFAISLIGAVTISATLTIPFLAVDHFVHIVAGTISIFEAFALWSGAI